MPASSTSKTKRKPVRKKPSSAVLKAHIDGAARGNPGPAGVGAVLVLPKLRKPVEISLFLGTATNNVAETMALVVVLQEALKLGYRQVHVRTDSELLANQAMGLYKVKDERLRWLHLLIQNLIEGLDDFRIQHIPREQNKRADQLANKAVLEGLRKQPHLKKRKSSPTQSSSDSSQSTFF